MSILSTKERKANLNTDDLIFRKRFNLSSGTLLSLSSYVDIVRSSTKYSSTESLTKKYRLFRNKSKQKVNSWNIPKTSFLLTPSRKYIMIEQFMDEIQGLKV